MTTPSIQSAATAPPVKKRSPIERGIVWTIILAGLVLAGTEYLTRWKFQGAWNQLQQALGANEDDGNHQSFLTDVDVHRILGNRKPEFVGHPGQIELMSQHYEVYVWRSVLKRKFLMPPDEPEYVDTYAIFTGAVRPDLIRYRTPEPKEVRDFFSAYRMFIYYGPEDPQTKSREVVHLTQQRLPYWDETLTLPSKEALAAKHKISLARTVGELSKLKKMSQEEIDKIDTWINPQPEYLDGSAYKNLREKYRAQPPKSTAIEEPFTPTPRPPVERPAATGTGEKTSGTSPGATPRKR